MNDIELSQGRSDVGGDTHLLQVVDDDLLATIRIRGYLSSRLRQKHARRLDSEREAIKAMLVKDLVAIPCRVLSSQLDRTGNQFVRLAVDIPVRLI